MKTTPTRSILLALALAAVALPSAAADFEKISSAEIASCHNANGTPIMDNGKPVGGFGGGSSLANLFNNNFSDYQLVPKMPKNGFILLTLASETVPNGYYVSTIRIGHFGKYAFTLQTSNDDKEVTDSTKEWTDVDGAVNCKTDAGTLSFSVGRVAKVVRYVFVEVPHWTVAYDAAEGSIVSEIEVSGLDPAVSCVHPSFTDWTVVQEGSCFVSPVEERECTVCHEKFSRTPGPLGHDYITTLRVPGSASSFGSGSVSCSRCDFSVDFASPVDLATLGGVAADNLVQFTDLTVSSSNHESWGIRPRAIIDNNWTWNWGAWWMAMTMNDAWVCFDFGTTIDLTKVEFAVHNHDHLIQFYKGGETDVLIGEVAITKDETAGAADYQRKSIYFTGDANNTGIALDRLKVMVVDQIGQGDLWGSNGMCVSEIRPYGTVVGAGKKDPGPPMFLLMQ